MKNPLESLGPTVGLGVILTVILVILVNTMHPEPAFEPAVAPEPAVPEVTAPEVTEPEFVEPDADVPDAAAPGDQPPADMDQDDQVEP